jgi:hypothetical protein
VLDGKGTLEPMERTKLADLLTACIMLVTPTDAPKRVERAAVLWHLLRHLLEAGGDQDLVLTASKDLVTLTTSFAAGGTAAPVYALPPGHDPPGGMSLAADQAGATHGVKPFKYTPE